MNGWVGEVLQRCQGQLFHAVTHFFSERSQLLRLVSVQVAQFLMTFLMRTLAVTIAVEDYIVFATPTATCW